MYTIQIAALSFASARANGDDIGIAFRFDNLPGNKASYHVRDEFSTSQSDAVIATLGRIPSLEYETGGLGVAHECDVYPILLQPGKAIIWRSRDRLSCDATESAVVKSLGNDCKTAAIDFVSDVAVPLFYKLVNAISLGLTKIGCARSFTVGMPAHRINRPLMYGTSCLDMASTA